MIIFTGDTERDTYTFTDKIDMQIDLDAALNKLITPFEKQLIIQWVEGWTQQELADELRMSQRTLSDRLVRIRKKLQRLLSDGGCDYGKNKFKG